MMHARIGPPDMEARAQEPDESRRSEPPQSSRPMAVREHSLRALLELNRELSVRFETRQVVDLVLFNLMGHLGTRQAALWLVGRSTAKPDLIRSHGIPSVTLPVVTAALRSSLERWSARSQRPVRVDDPEQPFDVDGVIAVRQAHLALVGPLSAHGEIIGFVALGRRADGDTASELDLEVFHSSLGVASVAIENSRLFHELAARNRSLAEAYRDLIELDQMKTEFVQNVNHELRTPLSVISGAVECLLDLPDSDANRQKLLLAISGQAGKLATMVQSLLDLTTISDTAAGELEPVDLGRFVERYAFERSARVAAARHSLQVRPWTGELSVRADSARLAQALDLLLDNALKFTPADCSITLSVTPDADDHKCGCLVFADNGPGLAPEQVERVFRPFYQADGSTTRTAGGLGIGLALVKRLFVSMGGRIDVESPPSGGTSFWIRLRRA